MIKAMKKDMDATKISLMYTDLDLMTPAYLRGTDHELHTDYMLLDMVCMRQDRKMREQLETLKVITGSTVVFMP